MTWFIVGWMALPVHDHSSTGVSGPTGGLYSQTGAPAGYNGTMGRYHAEQWVEKRPLEGHGRDAWYWVISPL